MKICDLPFEVLDLILSKAVLLQMYFGDKTKRPADRCIFINLASVNGIWSEIIKRRHFKMAVVQLLAVYFRKVKKRSTIIDHNYEFLKNVLQPDSLIDQLDRTGCLNQNQISSLKRIRKVKDKNDELLFLLRNFNSKNYAKFVHCLCVTDQNNAARVLEHGGETVKVHIANRDDFRAAELEISHAKKILEEQKEYYNELRWAGQQDEKRLNGAFLLHANQDHGITIWLWFNTEDAWNKMKANSKDVLLEIIQKLFQRRMPESTIESDHVQLQYINLNNRFAERKLLMQAKRRFHIRGNAEHVALLKDRIYVTQLRSILVYENEVPYPQLKDIRLPEAIPKNHTSLQIAVCQMHSCLYAADRDKQSIYKIEPMYDHRIALWLNEAGSLFVATTCSGEVLILRRKTGADSLRVFNNDGVLMHDMSVNNDLYNKVVSVQEIAPKVIALIYSNHRGRTSFRVSNIFTMRFNRVELVERKVTLGMAINCLVPFSSCQLLIGVRHDYDEEEHYRLGLYDYHFWSIQIQNILHEKTIPVDIYFSTDQKELFVLTTEDPKYLSEARKQFSDTIQQIDGMRKQSKRFPDAGEYEWLCDKRGRRTEMKRRLTDMEKINFKIEIYKMNYEDDDYD